MMGNAFLPVVLGVAAPIAWSRLNSWLGPDAEPASLAILALLYLVIGMAIATSSRKTSLFRMTGVAILVPLGVAVDVIVDAVFRLAERTLWMLEVMAIWGIVIVPLIAGTIVGWYIKSRPDKGAL